MYQVIAKFHSFKGKPVQPFYFAKTYKNLKNAEKFVESQKNHTKFYFEISKKEIDSTPISFPREA